jgi:hypothetical protein
VIRCRACDEFTDTRLILLDSAGVELDNVDDIMPGFLCSEIIFPMLAAGTYYLRVEYWDNTGEIPTYYLTGSLQ